MPQPYGHILVATDFSDEAERALAVGSKIAQRLGAKLTIAHAFNPKPYVRLIEPRAAGEAADAMAAAAHKQLEELRVRACAHLDNVATHSVRCDTPALGLTDYAKESGVSLIVVGTRGRGAVMRVLVGSVAERIVRHAHCDVLVARGDTDDWDLDHIVAPTDLSEIASIAATAAADIRKRFDCKVTLLHVFDDDVPVPAQEGYGLASTEEVVATLNKELHDLKLQVFGDDDGVDCQVIVGEHPADLVCTWCEDNDAQMVVVSTHGRTGIARVLVGSVAEQIIRYSPCPALAIRSKLAVTS
jgi:nucleotide-binding universal stress UspA family protein